MISFEKCTISAAVYKMRKKDVVIAAERPDKEVISVVGIHEKSDWNESILECDKGQMGLFASILKVKLWALLIGSKE